jgi:hypothetical protein
MHSHSERSFSTSAPSPIRIFGIITLAGNSPQIRISKSLDTIGNKGLRCASRRPLPAVSRPTTVDADRTAEILVSEVPSATAEELAASPRDF